MNRLIHILLSFAFTVVTCGHALAQKWEKSFQKTETYYEQGDYGKAAKTIDKTIKSVQKKLGPKSPVLALALVKQAKINVAFGVYTAINAPLTEALRIYEDQTTQNPVEYAFLLLELSEVLADYGNYHEASMHLTTAKNLFSEAGVIEEKRAEMDVLEARIMSGLGYYAKAIRLIDHQTAYFQQQITSANKKTADFHKKEFAEIVIIKANALRKMGDYLHSDSAFVWNQEWIEKNLGRSDILWAKNALLNALLLQENGLTREAQASLFEKTYTQAIRKYNPSHTVIMDISKNLMNAYYATGQKSRLKIINAEFKKALKAFPKNSFFDIADELRKIYFHFEDEDLSSLENKIQKLLVHSSIPENHLSRIELLEFANETALLMGKHKNTEAYQNNILGIKEVLYGTSSPEYHLTKIKLANYYVDYADKFDEVKGIYETSFQGIVMPEITEGHIMYLDILSHMATYFEETDQYKKSSDALDKALMAARRKYDNQDIEYGKALERIAQLEIKIGLYEKADTHLADAIRIFKEQNSGTAKAYHAVASITQAKLQAIRGEYDEAEESIFESEKLKNNSALTLESTGLDFSDDLAELYIRIGRLKDADKLLKNSLEEKVRDFGKESRQLNQTLVLSAELSLTRGEYTEAEQFARRAYTNSLGIFGEESSKTVPPMTLLAGVYTAIGDYDKAQELLTKSISIQQREFGSDHVDVGKTIAQLALVRYYKNDPLPEVVKLFSTAEKIIGAKLGSSNPTYAEILKNLSIVSIAQGKYTQAFIYLDDASRIWNKRIGKRNNLNAATVDVLKGDIYYLQKDYSQAETYYQDAKKRYQKFFSTSHPEYVKVQSKLSKTYYMSGDWRHAQIQMEEVLSNYKHFIETYFPALSEREKTKFWNTIKTDYEFYVSLIISNNRNEKYIGELYNNALLTKALLLNASIKIRHRIMGSQDEELIENYMKWVDKKELLTTALSMTNDQLVQSGINTGQLSNELEQLEKELSLSSELFGQEYEKKPITWEDIQKNLQENEYAMEMVRFRVFNHTFTDSIKYALLYVSGEKRSKPQLILLENGKDLEAKYLNFYRNTIKYKIKDTQSYAAFWEPISRAIGSVSTLYLSPDGVYNQINLEAIPLPEDGKYVIDNSNIILLSNTRELLVTARKMTEAASQQMALMFGNPLFYIETTPGIASPGSGHTRETTQVISQLPGTKKEIEEVKDLLSRKGWDINEYTDLEANEEAIKNVFNPKIFHVATHGFFQNERIEANAMDTELHENYLYENPLMKSGLLLAGAGDILNETRFNYNVNNGILTAYEAMNLNLDQTDLVVLSACETGLGEVESGEGVYGLQRAFMVAGAKTIIMSLFKVSDEATQQLMIKFYRKWIETGNKRLAFSEAKKEIRIEYRDPIYWGPFIMIGLE